MKTIKKPIPIKERIIRHLERIRKLKRHQHHPLLHHVHKKYNISKRTLFYVKEYGPHTHATSTILKESIKILLFASIISSVGGVAIESIKPLFVSLVPLIILLPVLNDMLGDYGTIISSRFSTMLHEGKVKKHPFKSQPIKELFAQIMIVAVIMAFFSSVTALAISYFSSSVLTWGVIIKVVSIVLIDVLLFVSLLFVLAVFAGLYYYRKKEDPNNFLIPLTTSVADMGNMIILALLVILFF